MATLVFLRRTPKEIEIFGGEVYFDIDGKNMGKLTGTDQRITVPAGTHTVKMYKTHTYDTFIGFAQSTIELADNESLMVKYSAPMTVNQPGNMMISTYSGQKSEEEARKREAAIQRDFTEVQRQKEQADRKYKSGVLTAVWVVVALVVVTCVLYGLIFSDLCHLIFSDLYDLTFNDLL